MDGFSFVEIKIAEYGGQKVQDGYLRGGYKVGCNLDTVAQVGDLFQKMGQLNVLQGDSTENLPGEGNRGV